MARKLGKDEILDRLLEAATVEWGRAEAEKMRPAFEVAAEAIRKVEEFQLAPEEELTYPETISRKRRGAE